MVRSYFPCLALMLVEGFGVSDFLKLPPDYEETFGMLKTPRGRKELSLILEKEIGEIPWDVFEKQLRAIETCRVGVVGFLDEEYPAYLRDIHDPPPIIFFKGDLDCLHRRGVAVVGTRKPSPRASLFAGSLAQELSRRGIMVSSGLARGIDTAVHKGSLAGSGASVGVVGTGLDVPYPRENAALMEEIAARGCLFTEQLMGTPPRAYVFPLRNRLISAVSRAVVVVEAGARSGALITARWALEQGREVGAVPGFPGDLNARGTNALLRSGAFLVEGVEDIMRAVPLLQSSSPGLGRGRGGRRVTLKEKELRELYEVLTSSPADVDSLAAHLGREVASVQRVLLELEMRGLAGRDGVGGYYKL